MHKLEKEQYLGNTKKTFTASPGIAIIETEYQNKVFEGWHSHNNAHITLFVKGGTTEMRKNRVERVGAGSLLFYHSDELHMNHDTLFPSRNINIEIEDHFLKKLNMAQAFLEKSIRNSELTKFLILKMFRETIISDTFSGDTVTMLFSQLNDSFSQLQRLEKIPYWVDSLEELLNDCWNENPNLQDLSKVLQISPITISKYFPRYFGCTLGEYMRRLKVSRALPMIQSNKSTLTEIGFACGFSDQSHFTRTFKDQTGFLPKQFQQI